MIFLIGAAHGHFIPSFAFLGETNAVVGSLDLFSLPVKARSEDEVTSCLFDAGDGAKKKE